MEAVGRLPFHKRFGVRVFLFNAILLLGIMVPTSLLRKMDYKELIDRIAFQSAFFDSCAERLRRLPEREWRAAIESFPRMLYQQRICVFAFDASLVYDGGISKPFDGTYAFKPALPDPYIDWEEENRRFDPGVYIAFLRGIDTRSLDPVGTYQAVKTIRYEAGLDRVIITGRVVHPSDGEGRVLTLSHSLVDILIHGRAIKERFLFIYALVVLLALLLTLLLTWSAINPLKRLYSYATDILASRWSEADAATLPTRGEIGDVCRALKRLIGDLKRQSECFERFSADVVHELKTPLAAIRSGLDVYAESGDEGERAETFDRIQRRIGQMEELMDEIRLIGSVEASGRRERCDAVALVCDEALHEFSEHGVRTAIDPDAVARSLPVSRDKLRRVLGNLLRNAASFSPAWGSVSLTLSLAGDNLVATVSDEGPGIAPEVFHQIADRFVSYRPASAERHSGLGLAIVDAILRGCGGSLRYGNRTTGGAEFTCLIPTCADDRGNRPGR